jgi:hypothetical protein
LRSGQYNVLADIANNLNLPLGNLKIQEKTYQNFKFYVNLIQMNADSAKLGYQRNVANARKQISAVQEIDEFIEQEESLKTESKALIILPDNEGIRGISDSNKNGILDKIDDKYEDSIKIAVPAANVKLTTIRQAGFNTIINDSFSLLPLSKVIVANSLSNDFIYNKDIHKIIIPFSPLNIEEIQDVLATADNVSEQTEIILGFNQDNNGIFEKQDIEEMIMSSYLGLDREIQLTDELMNGIQAHKFTNAEFIRRAVAQKFKLLIDLKIASSSSSYLLNILVENKVVGSIDERTWTYEILNKDYSKLMAYLAILIKRNISEMDYLNQWLTKIFYNKPFVGFKNLWSSTKLDSQAQFIVPFENEFFGQYTDLIKENSSAIWAEELVNQYPFWSVFKPALEQTAVKKISKEKEEAIFDYFSKIRTSYHTRIILQKWAKIGLIDSFIEDKISGIYICSFTKREMLYYKEQIKNYFLIFFSEDFILKVIPQFENTLQGLWNQFVNLYYREIQNLTEEMSYEMVRFLQFQLQEQDKKSYRNLRASNYLRAYPFRKQSNIDFNANLIETSSNLTRKTFDTVKEYVSMIGYKKAQWFDLFLSAKELLLKKPDYWILNFLYGLAATVVFEQNTDGFEGGLDQIAKAFTQLRISQNQSVDDFVDKQNFIYSKLDEQNISLRDQVKPYVDLSMHSNWIQQFNQKFLLGYE